jgi:hypothetical protein
VPGATQRDGGRERPAGRARRVAGRLELPLVALFLGLGFGLSQLTTRVVDWYVMTDELLYERLGISVAHSGSPLPRVHGVLIPSVNQLYPVLLGTVFGRGYVPGSLRDAHLLNAFVLASASIPAFLLARRVTGRRGLAYLVALLTVCVPWSVYASFLLTEVAGYPAFVWALLGIQHATVARSHRGDALAIGGLALAFLARTQFVILVPVVPVVLVAFELADAGGAGRWGRLRAAGANAVRRHRLLAWLYCLIAAGAIVLLAAGRVSSVLGTYADTVSGNLVPSGLGRALLQHVAVLALSVAIVPFVVGGAWLLANAVRPAATERYAFALAATTAIAALTTEVTIFDVRFGTGVVRDRYLFYLVPLVLVAFAAALGEQSWPRASLAVPALLTAAGLLVAKLPVYGGLNADAPASEIGRYVVTGLHSVDGARATLAGATVVLTLLFVQGSALLRHARLAALLAVLTFAALGTETGFAFADLLGDRGTSGRPITVQQGNVFDWVDRTVGTHANVTMLPYPPIDGDYWASVSYWWDMEFWNESVDRAAYLDGAFEGTPSTFPKLALRFDPRTGLANIAPTRLAVQLVPDSRFQLYGTELLNDRNAALIDTGGGRWRANWITFGLYDDGWTKPGVTVRVRVFPRPGAAGPELRTLELHFLSPVDGRAVDVVSDRGRWHGTVSASQGTTVADVPVCVPAHGFADVRIDAQGATPIHGDMRNYDTFGARYRTAGVFLSRIEVFGIGKAC